MQEGYKAFIRAGKHMSYMCNIVCTIITMLELEPNRRLVQQGGRGQSHSDTHDQEDDYFS